MAKDRLEQRTDDMDMLIRRYFDGCNEADVEKMVSCFPPGMYEGPFRSAQTIAEKWRIAVQTLGSYWTVDRLVIEPHSWQAVMEWTHFKTKKNQILRGIEWYELDPASGLIKEIRAYYASPQAPEYRTLELGGFDYADRNYPAAPPPGAR